MGGLLGLRFDALFGVNFGSFSSSLSWRCFPCEDDDRGERCEERERYLASSVVVVGIFSRQEWQRTPSPGGSIRSGREAIDFSAEGG